MTVRRPPLPRNRGPAPLRMIVISDKEGKPHVSGIPSNPTMAGLLFELIDRAEQHLGLPRGTARIEHEGDPGTWIINIPPCFVLELGESAIGGAGGIGVQFWSPDRDALPYHMRDGLPWWRTIRSGEHLDQILDKAISFRDWFLKNPDWQRVNVP